MNTALNPSLLDNLNAPHETAPSMGGEIPQVDLDLHVQQELQNLEKEAQQKKTDDLAFQIVRDYYISIDIFPNNINSIINEGSRIKKIEILDSVLDIYLNNSNSLNCPEYSLFITSITQKWGQETELEKVLSPLSTDLKNEIKLLVLKQMVSSVDPNMDYRKALSKQEYLEFLNEPQEFYEKQKQIKDAHVDEHYMKKMSSSYYSSYDYESNKTPRYTSSEDFIEALYSRIQLLDFHTSRQKRLELLSSIVSNLSDELKNYIASNPANFKGKVALVHQKLNSPTSAEKTASPPIVSQDKGVTPRASSLFGNFINMLSFWKSRDTPAHESFAPARPLTHKEKIQNELASSSAKIENLKFQTVLSSPQTGAALDLILVHNAQISSTIFSLDDASINFLSLEEAKVISRNIEDLSLSCQQANLLTPSSQEKIKGELEKIVLDTLNMTQALSASITEQKNELIIKNIQITNRLSNIRAKSQTAQQHMKLGK